VKQVRCFPEDLRGGEIWQKATKKEAKGEKSGGMFCQFRKKLYLCTAIQRKGIGDIHRKVDLT